MANIKVKDKVVDMVTGDVSVKERTFNISNRDPNNSIEYHKIADLLGINKFDRLDPHISEKLVMLYNWAAGSIKSNDVDKIHSYIDFHRKELGVTEVGTSLVNNLYKQARLDTESREKTDRFNRWEEYRAEKANENASEQAGE